jgi:DNA-binding LacI/PurR family transcriptional regulator
MGHPDDPVFALSTRHFLLQRLRCGDIVDARIEAEIQIPDQVAVLGVDNDPVICDCVQVPLSSVQHDLEGMAYEAAALLDRLINGEPPPKIPSRDNFSLRHRCRGSVWIR